MKKIYVMPSLKVKEIKVSSMICGSLGSVGVSETSYDGQVYSKGTFDFIDESEEEDGNSAAW